ncbi:hypothetical protein QR685DRAFT_60894 [Neurospora intermedia]|uniref:Uncharacterized protein n=1 Tax=Neurospora intermedia TaxID=5142 RepID=A0ABR3DT48_NEUIN
MVCDWMIQVSSDYRILREKNEISVSRLSVSLPRRLGTGETGPGVSPTLETEKHRAVRMSCQSISHSSCSQPASLSILSDGKGWEECFVVWTPGDDAGHTALSRHVPQDSYSLRLS